MPLPYNSMGYGHERGPFPGRGMHVNAHAGAPAPVAYYCRGRGQKVVHDALVCRRDKASGHSEFVERSKHQQGAPYLRIVDETAGTLLF